MVDKVQVTHENFEKLQLLVEAGSATFWISTYTRVTKITGKTIASFRKAGAEVLTLDHGTKGFYLQSGRLKLKVLPGYLFATAD